MPTMHAMMLSGFNGTPVNFAGVYAHWFFCIATLVGLVLLVAWMIKTLKPEKLILWAAALTIIGILGVLLTVQMTFPQQLNERNAFFPGREDLLSMPGQQMNMPMGAMMKMMGTQQQQP